jgi:hypothetical protein
MTDEIPEDAADAFAASEVCEPAAEGYAITTSTFTARVTADEGSEAWTTAYTVEIRVPTLDAATADEIPAVVATDWVETFERRLEHAPTATRASVDLTAFAVEQTGAEVRIEYGFEWGTPERAVEIARTFAEYVEGTYVEGIVPGYEYEPPVSTLLASASQSGESGTPL